MKKLTIFLFAFFFLFCSFTFVEGGLAQAKSPFEIDVSLSYLHSSNNRLAVTGYSVYEVVNIGRLEVRKIRRDILNTNIRLRHTTPETSIELIIPYSFRRDEVIKYADSENESGDATVEVKSGNGLGDILLNIQTDIKYGDVHLQNTQVNLGLKTSTGRWLDPKSGMSFTSGHYGFKFGISHMIPIDPIVLFGSTNYFWNVKERNIDPGDSFQYTMGVAYALTQNFSVNARFEHTITGNTINQGEEVLASNVNSATLYMGGSYITQEGIPYDFVIGTGLTEDAADFSFQVGRPFYF